MEKEGIPNMDIYDCFVNKYGFKERKVVCENVCTVLLAEGNKKKKPVIFLNSQFIVQEKYNT